MFSESDLHDLLSFSSERPVVSLYLNIYPHGPNSDNTRLKINHLLKDIDLKKDVENIQKYISMDYDGKGRSLVLFSSAEVDFFKVYTLEIPVVEQVKVMDHPFVSPMIGFLEKYSKWGIVLVDRQGARLFTYDLGELVEEGGFLGEAVKQVKRGGGASMFGRMGGSTTSANVENVIEHNISEISTHVSNFIAANHIRRILIGGNEEAATMLRTNLPKSLQTILAAVFPISITADHGEIASHCRELIEAFSDKLHADLVEQAITLAAKGDRGAIGLDDVLNAIHSGQVQTLLVENGYVQPGFRCHDCGYMMGQSLQTCPFCGGQFVKIPDAVAYSVQEVSLKNAGVHFIDDSQPLHTVGGIAAIMRY